MDNWTIQLNGGDLGAASKFANIPYTTESSYTGDWHTVQKMAGFIRRLFIETNGYNPVYVKRKDWQITYHIMPHFGMSGSILLTITKENTHA